MIEVGSFLKQLFDDLELDEIEFINGTLQEGRYQNVVFLPTKVVPFREVKDYSIIAFMDSDRIEIMDQFFRSLSIFGGISKYIYTDYDENRRPLKSYIVELDVIDSDDANDELGNIGVLLNTRICIKEI